jgi:fructokinase
VTSAGSGNFGADGNVGLAAKDGSGQILVLGECLVDLAADRSAYPGEDTRHPAGQHASGEGTEGAAGARTEHATTGATPGVWRPPPQHLVGLPGGGPANVAVGLARLGVPSAFAGRFSTRGFGPWLRDNLAGNGIDLRFSVDADEDATIALVTLDSEGRASYTFYGPTTADWQWTGDELPDLSALRQVQPGPPVSAVHTGSIVLVLEPGASAIAAWLTSLRRQAQVLVSFDPNVRLGLVDDLAAYRQRLTIAARSAHIVKASTDDIEAVYPGRAPAEVVQEWLALGVPLVVVTEGPDGATAYHQSGSSAHCQPPPIKLADTIGAGDAFTSAFLAYFRDHELLNPGAIDGLTEADLKASVAQAVAASALTCSRLGADPPDQLELARFVGQN